MKIIFLIQTKAKLAIESYRISCAADMCFMIFLHVFFFFYNKIRTSVLFSKKKNIFVHTMEYINTCRMTKM